MTSAPAKHKTWSGFFLFRNSTRSYGWLPRNRGEGLVESSVVECATVPFLQPGNSLVEPDPAKEGTGVYQGFSTTSRRNTRKCYRIAFAFDPFPLLMGSGGMCWSCTMPSVWCVWRPNVTLQVLNAEMRALILYVCVEMVVLFLTGCFRVSAMSQSSTNGANILFNRSQKGHI